MFGEVAEHLGTLIRDPPDDHRGPGLHRAQLRRVRPVEMSAR